MLTESTLKSLGLALSGDFESLKRFVSESLKLDGVWSQPGGDKKVFTAKDVCIIWRRNKSFLVFEGVKPNQLKKEVCRLMCDYPSKSLDTSVEFENLKHGQLLNSKAIQELSDTGRHIDAVISQVQDFMEKNKRNSKEKVFQRENLHASFVNEMQCCDANDVDQNKSTNLEQLKTIAIADGDYNLVCSAIKVPCVAEPTGNNQITHNSHITSSFSDDELTQVKATVCDNTYAKVAARLPVPSKMNQCMVASKDTSPHHELPANIDDGFKGVKRRRNRIKRFFLSGIAASVKEMNIRAYLEKRNVKPTHISIFKSRREGTVSAKINIPASDAKLVNTDEFWPWQHTYEKHGF